MKAVRLSAIASELERLVRDLDDAMPGGRPQRQWSPVRVDVVRRRARVLIGEALTGLGQR